MKGCWHEREKNCSRNVTLSKADATEHIPRVTAIITDLPYGVSTSPVDLQELTKKFLKRASASTKRVIMGVPRAVQTPGWNVRLYTTMYVHKVMTRHFYVLERK